MKSTIQKLLVNTNEASAMLGLSPRTVWAMGVNRELPRILCGRAVRFAVADLEQWIEQQKCQSANSK